MLSSSPSSQPPSSQSSLPQSPVDESHSSGFFQLHDRVRRWIWRQGWTELREIQEQAIGPILAGNTDLILSAATAGGKTEAAFLPIFSNLLSERSDSSATLPFNTGADFPTHSAPASPQASPQSSNVGIQVLYLSPLKALINDQHRRLSELGEDLEIAIHPWHGDIDAGRKKKVLKQPSGIVLITPESLEALFVRRGSELTGIFQGLQYLVIDELHSFIGLERGMQLQSLLHRVEQVVGRVVPRIGLSATIGDLGLAAEFLRPGQGSAVRSITSSEAGQELKVQVRGYRKLAWNAPEEPEDEPEESLEDESEDELEDELLEDELEVVDPADEPEEANRDELDIAAHLFKVLRGTNNLVFVNRRSEAESYADRLRRLCEQAHVPNEFFPHHGNLSKELREEAEQALREDRPANVVCTTTLEMGIDIGAMTSIAQIGAPFSVTSTRQRLGRSGRREGDPAILRIYISEPEVTPETTPQDALHPQLVQAIAIINLLIQGWCEPPLIGKLHLSTLVQQFLSLVAQHSGVRANQAWQWLCQTGPFRAVDQTLFIQLLRCLGTHDLIQQSRDGLLLLGLSGERLVNHYSFYTAFQTPEEYRVVTSGKTLGTLPVEYPLVEGTYVIFAGHRWKILTVDVEHKIVQVERSSAGRAPSFSGNSGWIHDRIRQEMFRLYETPEMPIFLDATARDLLLEARAVFAQYELASTPLLSYGKQTLLFSWAGDVVLNTLMVQLQARGVAASRDSIALVIDNLSPPQVQAHLQAIAQQPPVDAVALAGSVKNLRLEKHDRFLSDELLQRNYASGYLDVPATRQLVRQRLLT